MSAQFTPVSSKHVFEQIVELLKEKVFSGEYRPGDRLPAERELADILQVSRLSVREAYRALSLYGMVEIRRGQFGGAFIKVPLRETMVQSISDFFRLQGITLAEWVEARLHLELAIAKLVVQRARSKDFQLLDDCLQRALQRIEAGIPAHDENIQFHFHLSEIAANRILHTAYCPLMDMNLTNLKVLHADLEQSQEVANQHISLLALLKTGDLERVLQAVEEHILGSKQRLMELSKKSPLFKPAAEESGTEAQDPGHGMQDKASVLE